MSLTNSEQTLGLENKKKPNKVRFHGEDSDGEFDSDDEFPDYLLDENDPDAMRKMGFEGYARVQDDWDVPGGDVKYLPGGDKASTTGAVGPLSAEAREALELQFEKTMLEYDDEEIGYLDDVSIAAILSRMHCTRCSLSCCSLWYYMTLFAVARWLV